MACALKIRQVQSSHRSVVPLRLSAGNSKKIKNPPASEAIKETLEDVVKSGDEDKRLGNGWYKLTPLLNAWVKVLDTGLDVPSTVWMIVYVKEHASIYYGVPHKPVPKNSLIYKYILSKDPKKQETLRTFEKVVMEEFLGAKRFLPIGLISQTGLEIVGKKKFFMSVRGLLGLEVTCPYVDDFLRAIDSEDQNKVRNFRNYFRAAFAHEIAHLHREEILSKDDIGEEIASHAVEILAGFGENPMKDMDLEDYIKSLQKIMKLDNYQASYLKDVITAMKVVQQKLIQNRHCQYIPRSYVPDELNKAIKSIPEKKREEVLKKIVQEIMDALPIELLRIAAQVNRV